MGCKPCGRDRYIPPFAGWVPYNATLPKLYWDTFSFEQRIHAMCDMMHRIACYADMLGIEIDKDHTDIEALEREFDEFKASGFVDYYEAQVNQWIADNLEYIYRYTAKQVYFGLSIDGHLICYIPESWNDIMFDTGYDYDLDTYGRLILRWDVNNARPVDQTPEPNHMGLEG